MARGDQENLNPVSEQMGLVAEDWTTDAFEVQLVSDDYASAIGFSALVDFTEVSGGVYAAKACPVTWTRSGGKTTLQASDVSWAQDGAGPQDVRCAILVNTTAVAVLTVVDMTLDGTTPIDNQVAPISVNYSLSATIEVE